MTEPSLSSGDGRCGSEPRVEIERTDDGIQIEGDVIAPTPCHEATLEAVAVENDELRLVIGVRSTGAMGCSQCLAAIDFEATAALGGAPLAAVQVDLRGNRPTTARLELD